MYDRNNIAKLALEGGIKVRAALDCAEAVAIRQFGEDTNVAAVFELDACVRGKRNDQSDKNFGCSMLIVRVAILRLCLC